MSLGTIIVLICAMVGVVWCYPRLPNPWNFVLVGVVAVVCILILINFGGVNFRI